MSHKRHRTPPVTGRRHTVDDELSILNERLPSIAARRGTGPLILRDRPHADDGFRSAYEQPDVGEQLGMPISEAFEIGDITYHFFEYGAFRWGPEATDLVPLGNWEPQPWDALDWDSTDLIDLSNNLPGERMLEVDLSAFTLTARVGDKIILQSITSIGMPQAPTVTRHFSIYLKHEIQSLSDVGLGGQPFSALDTRWVTYFCQDCGYHSSNRRTEHGIMDSQGCVVPPDGCCRAVLAVGRHRHAQMGPRVATILDVERDGSFASPVSLDELASCGVGPVQVEAGGVPT